MNIFSYTDASYAKPGFIHPDWPVPYLEGYSVFLKETENLRVYIFRDESGTCVPIQIRQSKLFRMGQLLYAPTNNGQPVDAKTEADFYVQLMHFLSDRKFCHRLQQPHPMGMSLTHPEGSAWCHFGTYVNDLQRGSDEELLYTYDPKYRKAVQHSIKNGGRIEFGPTVLDDFYTLYTATTSRAGIYTDSKNYFIQLLQYLPDHTDIGVVYDENGPIGSIFTLWSGYHSLCTHAGSGGESKLYGGMKHLHYAMMLRMKNRGVKWYDLVGVRINSDHPALQGVFRFKKGFGGELKQGYLWKKDIAPFQMQVFDLLLKIKNKGKAPHGDIIDQEKNASKEPKEVKVEETTES